MAAQYDINPLDYLCFDMLIYWQNKAASVCRHQIAKVRKNQIIITFVANVYVKRVYRKANLIGGIQSISA